MTGIEHRNKEFDPIDVDSEKLQDQNPDYIGCYMFLKQIFLIRLLQAQTTVIIFMRILTGPIVSLGQFLWIAKIQKAF